MFRLSSDPHDQSRFSRRLEVEAPALGRVFLPKPEDIIVTKLRWALHSGRGKDRDDARDVIAVQGDRLDFDYIHRWASTARGSCSTRFAARSRRFDRLVMHGADCRGNIDTLADLFCGEIP